MQCEYINVRGPTKGVRCLVKPKDGCKYCSKHKDKVSKPSPIKQKKAPVVKISKPSLIKQKKTSNTKEKIPAAVRNSVWNTYIGVDLAQDKCFCCNDEPITKSNSECGHILSEKEGGNVNIQNLRPLCK